MRSVVVAALVTAVLSAVGCSNGSDPAAQAPTTQPGGDEPLDVKVATSTVPDEVSEALAAALVDTMERLDVPGAAVAIDAPELGEWSATAGVADIGSGEPMAIDLQWPIRSITKSFTVTVLLQLVDEGLVSLDDTIDRWVPGIPNGKRITLGQLADMTSGVPDYTGDAFIEDFTDDPTAAFTRDQLLGYVRAGEPSSEPGEDRHYINSSTVLLGEVIEQLEGQPFAEVLRRRILDPLGLGSTAYPTDVDGFTAEHPTGYQPDEGALSAAPVNFTVFDTAGAMTSTVEDLMVWGPALAEGSLLAASTHEQRLVGSALSEGPEYDRYASGIGEIDGWWGHTGEGFGYTTLVMHDPVSGATAVVLMNVSNLPEHPPTVFFRQASSIIG